MLLGFSAFFLPFKTFPTIFTKIQNTKPDCVTKIEEREVRGDSMRGLVDTGEQVQLLFGYYKCNEVERWDIVAYNFAGDDVPIIKTIHGIPGDVFKITRGVDLYWRLVINDEIQKTSEAKEYFFDENTKKMLSLYEESYHGIIPEDAYLILGNVVTGSVDSSRFGLVGKQDILAKVIVEK